MEKTMYRSGASEIVQALITPSVTGGPGVSAWSWPDRCVRGGRGAETAIFGVKGSQFRPPQHKW